METYFYNGLYSEDFLNEDNWGSSVGKYIENPEYIAAWLDANDKVIFGLKPDGKTYVGDSDFLTEIKNNHEAIEIITSIIGNWPIECLSGKKVSILGDSISTFNQEGYMIPGYEMWYPHEGDRSSDVTSVTDTWWMQVINSIDGILEINASYSGSTASNLTMGFSPRVPLLGNPDIIYIALGTNDSGNAVPIGDINFNAESYDLSLFAPAYIKGIKDTIAAYPKAKIICVAFDMGVNYQNAIKSIAEHYGAEFIYVGDITDVHPNKAEMAAAANRIIEFTKFTITDAFYNLRTDIDDIGKYVENTEYIEAKTDSEGKILAGRTLDGASFENVGFYTPKISIDDHIIENFEDPEERSEIITDSEGKIISYRDDNGILYEKAGLETPSIEGVKKINGLSIAELISSKYSTIKAREYDLPKYGKVDITKELSFTDGENSYTPNKISKVSGKYYVTSTLVNGQVVETSIEVTSVESDIDITQWPENKDKHYCKVDIDFSYYLKGTYYVVVSYQGDSTMSYPKKNFRFTFYKDEVFSKKLTIKIGEFIPANKYNLKAYYWDNSLIKEPFCYRLVQSIMETRDYNEQYPWNKYYNIFTEATGLCINFPVRVDVSGDMYGINWFGLAKDPNNYMLDEDAMDGILVQADTGNEISDFWHVLHEEMWNDILADTDNELAPETLPSFTAFYEYINSGSGFNRETAPSHLNINAWIDCFIIFEFLCCTDSLAKNFMLYSDKEKQVYWPMYYDMDYAMGSDANKSVLDVGIAYDKSLWINFYNLYKDEIKKRYLELRGKILNEDFLIPLVQNLTRSIPYADYYTNWQKWTYWSHYGTADIENWLKDRIIWMDSYYLSE